MDPVKLYKEGSEKLIASVDVPGWLADGWSTKPIESSIAETKTEELSVDLSEPETEAVEPKNVKRK